MKHSLEILFLILLSCVFLCFKPAKAQDDFAYSESWLSMVHYHKTIGGYESTIDTKNFFLSPHGKYNPQEELSATLDLFASNQDEKKCLFPARYMLLRKNGLMDYEFPHCNDLEKFYKDLQPAGITLLFTDAYMNNPSSLFGHTLIRIDTGRKGTQLVAHGANYGAYTGDTTGVLFAILGLTGGYYGGFTVKPYYDVINLYNNIENRDIWEFSLDFSEEEKNLFVAHLWEVGQAQSRYFFFSRNCSYMLMEMFDAVRPELKLAEKFPVHAIPLDTLKAAYNANGLIGDINYRPSRQRKIKARVSAMSKDEKKHLIKVINDDDYDYMLIPEDMRANVLETAYQYVQYRYVAKKLELKDYRQKSFRLLKGINLSPKNEKTEIFEEKNPVKSHDSMRFEVMSGFRNGDAYQEISYRPAYHSLTDSEYGFLRGAEINFLNATVRHYDNSKKTVVQALNVLNIKSYSAIDELFAPISYDINIEVQREENPLTGKEGYNGYAFGGAGASYSVNDHLLLYGLSRTYLAYGSIIPHNHYIGVSGAIGALTDVFGLRILAEAEKVFASNSFGDKTKYKIDSAYPLSRNTALTTKYSFEDNRGRDFEEISFGLRVYFY